MKIQLITTILALLLGGGLERMARSQLIITGVFDGPLPGGNPKGIELYVEQDIPDLSVYAVGSANNGGGTDGEEFFFANDSKVAGDFIYVASEETGFDAFFGFQPDHTASAMLINGDDAIELFRDGMLIDVFGEIDVDGTDQPWEYIDGWAYRKDATGPDGSTFALDNWLFSGPDALDGESTNQTSQSPVPLASYGRSDGMVTLEAGDADQNLRFDQFDIIKVQTAGKYLTGQGATWGEGDWDGAPGGTPGNPPVGNGMFDQLDIVAALNAATYLSGPYRAVRTNGQRNGERLSVGYDANTGEFWIESPKDMELTSIKIDSAEGIFSGDPARNLSGALDSDSDYGIFKATFGSNIGSLSFGAVARTGLSKEFVREDLSVAGSLLGGGELGEIELVYVAVPEPSTIALLGLGLALTFAAYRRRVSNAYTGS